MKVNGIHNRTRSHKKDTDRLSVVNKTDEITRVLTVAKVKGVHYMRENPLRLNVK
jgi:hypothetical protein